MYGTVKLYKSERGYGFIRIPASEDIFFHISDFPPGSEPHVGLTVEFTIGKRKGRELAIDIKPVGEAENADDSPPGESATAAQHREVRAVLGGAA